MNFKRGHTHPGLLISFEGGEGSGKTTQIEALSSYLRGCFGYLVLNVREPGGTDVGEQIRHVLKHSHESEAMVPEAELLLFAASRAQLVREIVQPALARGKIVIYDRFYDSSTVYQGEGRKLKQEDVAMINRFAIGNVRPDITFVLDVDPRVGLERARGREIFRYDRMESQVFDFYERIRQGYIDLTRREPERCKLIESVVGDPTAMQARIREYVERYIDHFNLHGNLKR